MNAYSELAMKSDDVLRVELGAISPRASRSGRGHRRPGESACGDPLTVKRLKQQKLRLKDRIAYIEDRLMPDIIA